MTIYAVWHGGTNYSASSVADDVEAFASIRAAGDALRDRANLGHWQQQTFHYVHRANETALTPNADEGCSMDVYLSDPSDERDPYPDRVITIGPRGGVKVERR